MAQEGGGSGSVLPLPVDGQALDLEADPVQLGRKGPDVCWLQGAASKICSLRTSTTACKGRG
jgi:hypothetical protein